MKSVDPEMNPRWNQLIRIAQADTQPDVDVAALLRRVRTEHASLERERAEVSRAGLTVLAETFSTWRVASWMVPAVCALTLVTVWQAWDCWQLAWVELAGGAL